MRMGPDLLFGQDKQWFGRDLTHQSGLRWKDLNPATLAPYILYLSTAYPCPRIEEYKQKLSKNAI
jgi:hypothetical protein